MNFIPSLPRLSGWYRLLIFLSCIWLIAAFMKTRPGTHHEIGRGFTYNIDTWARFLLTGILPLLLLWGAVWVVQGFKKGKKGQINP